MANINAEQLFFSRVESEFSPDARSGYQVVYKTSGIVDEEAKEIEKRVQCFKADAVMARYQYFHTTTQKVVLTCSALIPETDTRITDKSGRPGAFVAHCLLLDRRAFSQIDNNPFVIFDVHHNRRNGLFVLEPENMIDVRAKQSGPINLQTMPMKEPDQDEANSLQEWNEVEFKKLWALGADAEEIINGNRSVMMRSEDEFAIQSVLKFLFFYLTPELRLHCTFDTFIDNCVPAPGVYWALGGERRNSNSRFIQANLDLCKVNYDATKMGGSPHPKVPHYSKWLYDFLERSSYLEVIKHIPTIQIISKAFACKTPIYASNADLLQTSFQSFVSVHSDDIRSRLTEAISATIDQRTAEGLIPIIWEEISSDLERTQDYATHDLQYYLSAAAQQNFHEHHELANRIYGWILDNRLKVARWQSILEFAQSTYHRPLVFLASTQKSKIILGRLEIRSFLGSKLHRQALKELGTDYDSFINLMNDLILKWVEPVEFVSNETAHFVVRFLNNRSRIVEALTENQQRDLMNRIIKHGGGEELEPDVWNLECWQDKNLKSVKKMVKKHKIANPRFIRILEHNIQNSAYRLLN
ncbi:MAG: hypothetical protein AAF702_21470 [Chloroflexota bacterium]